MTTKPPARLAPAARQLLLAAERLFGERGFDGVSIRDLLAASGQANKSAVHHYFGSKEGLLEAVRVMRMPQIEEARLRWNEQLPPPSLEAITTYLGALFLPILEALDDQELESFAQFNLRLLHDNIEELSHLRISAASPRTRHVVEGLRACCAYLPEATFRTRLRLAVGVLLGGVGERRIMRRDVNSCPAEVTFWADTLSAAAGVLVARDPEAALSLTERVVRPTRQRDLSSTRDAVTDHKQMPLGTE